MTIADRILVVLGAVLLTLANELRLFNARPRMEEGAYVHQTLMRGVNAAEPVFLSGFDLALRGGLLFIALLAAMWALRASFREAIR